MFFVVFCRLLVYNGHYNTDDRGILMKEYTLYLDESETANFNKIMNRRENTVFVIAGIICENNYHDQELTHTSHTEI